MFIFFGGYDYKIFVLLIDYFKVPDPLEILLKIQEFFILSVLFNDIKIIKSKTKL